MRGLCKLLAAALLLFPAAGAEAQSGLPEDDRHGKEGTWNLGPKEFPPTDEKRKKRGEKEDDPFASVREKMRVIDCHLREVQELGRIYVQELSGGPAYWVQLPDDVKIRAFRRADFDGRKKLKLEDLEAGQQLELKLRKDDDQVQVVRVKRPSTAASARG